MSPRRPLAAAAGALLAALLLLPAAPGARGETPPGMVPFEIAVSPSGGGPSRSVAAWEREGAIYLGANEISAILGLTKFWRPELGRLVLAGKEHRVTLTEGTDLAVIDDGTLFHLPGPAFLWEGQMLLPLDLFLDAHGERRAWVEAPLVFVRETRRLRLGGEKPSLRSAAIAADSLGWTLRLESSARIRYELLVWERSEFAVRLADVTYDPLLLPLPTEHPWFQGLRLLEGEGGLEVRFTPGPGAVGYRVAQPDTQGLEVRLGIASEELDRGVLRAFAPTGMPPGRLERIVLDPGHGGRDSGDALPGGKKESEVAWELAQRLRDRLEGTLGADVFLTRDRDHAPGPEVRVDAANRAEADLFLSLHVHARGGGPAGFVVTGSGVAGAVPEALDDLGFRRFGSGRAPREGESRAVALALLEALANAGLPPAQGVHAEMLPELTGAAMPGVLLELGSDPKKPWNDDRLDAVADAIARALEESARGRFEDVPWTPDEDGENR